MWGIALAFAIESSLSLLSKISISKKAYPWSHFNFNQLHFKYEKKSNPSHPVIMGVDTDSLNVQRKNQCIY